jgi:cytoskeletal protein RodZ
LKISVIAIAPAEPLNNSIVPTVAKQLLEAREAKKLTVQQVADITKIRTDHVRAIEEGNFDVFSAPVYIRGFVRSYATLLKLDVARVMAELDAELAQTQKFAEPPPLSDEPKGAVDFLMLQLSKLDWRKGVIALGVLAVIIIVVAAIYPGHRSAASDDLKDQKPGLYQPTQGPSGETLPVPAPRH